MIERTHGGTGWMQGIETDLSASVNASPLPETVYEAVREAASMMDKYPDPEYRRLREAIGELEDADPGLIVCGNGASELFTALTRAYAPGTIGLMEPCYSGYAGAAHGIGTVSFDLREENGFAVDEEAVDFLRRTDMDMLFLADPNNPTGRLIAPDIKEELLSIAADRGITVVLDECFIDLTAGGLRDADCFRVKAFTKTFAVPGARIGYLIAPSEEAADRVRLALPEWNLSCFSEAVGIACAGIQRETGWVSESLDRNEREKALLTAEFRRHGVKVYPSDANFFLVRLPEGDPRFSGLRDRLISKHGILLRDCRDFRGLGSGYLRVSVGTHIANSRLISALQEELP